MFLLLAHSLNTTAREYQEILIFASFDALLHLKEFRNEVGDQFLMLVKG